MKIFLDKKQGKKHIIIQRMEPHWNAWGHEIVWSPKGADVQLCLVKRNTLTDLPFVLRLDGIYYGNDIPKNRELSYSHHHADGVIYQSRWCKEQAEKFLKPLKEGAVSDIIYNGIDPIPESVLIPAPKNQINIMATSRWRRWKRLKEITKVFKTAQRNSDLPIALHIFGETYGFKEPQNEKIVFYGKIDRGELWGYYLLGHVFVHLSKNDWCPNAVIEAYSFGMPLLASSAGAGTLELMQIVGTSAGLYVNEGPSSCEHDPYDEGWNSMSKEQMEDGAQKLIYLCKSDWRPVLPKELHIGTTAQKYIEIMRGVMR